MKELAIETTSVAETRALAETLGRHVQGGQVVALSGDLGAGKTTFVQGLAAGLGVRDRVTSPTFVLVNDYDADRSLHLVHADTYRLGQRADEAVDEAATFGLDDYLDDADAVIAIEWAERVQSILPADHLSVAIEIVDGLSSVRVVYFTAGGPQSEALLEQLAVTAADLIRIGPFSKS